jgi:predicted lipoprotein with Yx(FWY)xxD motif
MNRLLHTRLRALGVALGALGAVAVVFAAVALGGTSSARNAPKGSLVALKKTTLGSILVDARGRTLYLFAKDRSGVSACNTACLSYWPALTSRAAPRAGTGVQKSMLRLTKQTNGVRQVTYAGHPLYTFVGDKSAGATTGEGLQNFGAGWYALAANGHKVVKQSTTAGGGGGGGYGGGGYGYGG